MMGDKEHNQHDKKPKNALKKIAFFHFASDQHYSTTYALVMGGIDWSTDRLMQQEWQI